VQQQGTSSDPRRAVCVTALNRAGWLRGAIDSVLAQSGLERAAWKLMSASVVGRRVATALKEVAA
jgi:hypothetical protein